MTIEEYLVKLRRHLRVGPLTKRRILREVEAHLADAAAREGDEERAVSQMGSPSDLAARFTGTGSRRFPIRAAGVALAAGTACAVAVLATAIGTPVPPRSSVQSSFCVNGHCFKLPDTGVATYHWTGETISVSRDGVTITATASSGE